MPEIIKIDSNNPQQLLILRALEILKKGGIIAFPTETFYGLGVDINNDSAIDKIYHIKERKITKPIPIIIGNRRNVKIFTSDIPDSAKILMDIFWPGGLTLIFKASPNVSQKLTAGTGKIAIRLSSNIIATYLTKNISKAITATSANISGKEECTSVEEVLNTLDDKIDIIIDGAKTPGGKGSTIVDVTTDEPTIIREGVIPSAVIFDRLEKN